MERTLGHETGLELTPRPGDRLTGRELLRSIDRRSQEDKGLRSWELGIPARGWRNDPRYGF